MHKQFQSLKRDKGHLRMTSTTNHCSALGFQSLKRDKGHLRERGT